MQNKTDLENENSDSSDPFAGLALSKLARVNVIGTSGSGKSTFARKLAKQLGLLPIEMDRLFWAPDWQPVDIDVFRGRLKAALDADRWVLDGNYMSKTEDIKWERVTTVIWLDYSFPRTLRQAIVRAIRRACSREEIWPNTGNSESFRQSFLSRDSFILWTITSFYPGRSRYKRKMRDSKFSHIHFVRLNHPRKAEALLDEIARIQQTDSNSSNSTESDHRREGSQV